jgi:hypothetical protein
MKSCCWKGAIPGVEISVTPGGPDVHDASDMVAGPVSGSSIGQNNRMGRPGFVSEGYISSSRLLRLDGIWAAMLQWQIYSIWIGARPVPGITVISG